MCGLCIDACDSVMTKVGRPTGLIAYDNDVNIKRRLDGKENVYRLVRPRTADLCRTDRRGRPASCCTRSLTRSYLDISVLHDRNPVAVRLSDGSVRNAYTVRLLNKHSYYRTVALDRRRPAACEDAGGRLRRCHRGPSRTSPSAPTRPPSCACSSRCRRASKLEKSTGVTFRVSDTDVREAAAARDHFILP